MAEPTNISVIIRSFHPEDQAACRKLYVEGLIRGKIADNDTGFDIDDIAASYTKKPGDHFWVAVNQAGDVVGMIGVHQHEEGTGEIRRLRVRRDQQRRGIGSKLMETAVQFCQECGHLKVTLDTFMDRDPALKLFEKFHFRLSRSRTVGEKELMYFYRDLYTGPVKKD
jgi:ribosomal protein S18 acetylase RimI-like enzyme